MKHTITLLFLLLTTITFSQIPTYVPSNGLVGWWPFNGNANDESGNGNNGTVNGASLTVDRFGAADKAYSFDGVNDNISTVVQSLPQSNLSRSISFWSKYTGPNVNLNQQHIIGYGPIINNSRFAILYWPNFSNHIAVVGQANDFDENVFTMDNNWHFYTVTYNGIDVLLYIDGLLVSQSVKNYSTTGSELFIGYNGNNTHHGGELFHGNIDDIGLWNRALTEAEVALLYAGCNLSVSTQPQDQSVATSVGTASFSTSVSSTSATYQWQTNLGLGFQSLSNAGQYSGATSATLTVSGLSLSNNNQVFRCIINDSGCADTTAEAVLTIIDDASIQSHNNTFLQLYPNPVKDVMTLVGLKGEAVSFAVYSVDGKLIKSGQTSGEIQLEDLKKGNYILKIENQALPFVKL
jgi:hypothetical protein